MIPASLAARLLTCSDAELEVLWDAFDSLISRMEKGRPYGRDPGGLDDHRDFDEEGGMEGLDATLYRSMKRRHQRLLRATAPLPPTHSSEAGSRPEMTALFLSPDSPADIALGSPSSVACPNKGCGKHAGYACWQTSTTVHYCDERIAAHLGWLAERGYAPSPSVALDLPDHDACDCAFCQRFRSVK